MINYRKIVNHPMKKFTFKEINMYQLDKIFSKIKKSTTLIDDGVSMAMINIIKDEIKPLILKLVNQMISTNQFPSKLKISKIVPHFKNYTNIVDPKNLCPIYMISALSKIIEKVFYFQIINYLSENKLVSQSFHGGYKGR